MKFRILSLVCFLLLAALPYQAKGEEALLFVTVENFAPYAWHDGDKPTGIDVEIVQQLSKRSGIPIKVELLPTKRVILMTQSGEATAAFAAFKTPGRESIAQFIDTPLHFSTYQIFVRKGNEFPFRNVMDLRGKILGRNRGFHISKEFSKAENEKQLQVFEVNQMDQSIQMLLKGRLDAFVGNKLEVAYALKKLGLSDDVTALPKPVRPPVGAHVMISKAAKILNREGVINQLSQTLQDMTQDGSMDAVYAKYGN